jgi:hypothetical protein
MNGQTEILIDIEAYLPTVDAAQQGMRGAP